MKWYACEEATLHEGDAVPPHSGHALTLVGKTLLYAVGGADTSNVYVLDISMSLLSLLALLPFRITKLNPCCNTRKIHASRTGR